VQYTQHMRAGTAQGIKTTNALIWLQRSGRSCAVRASSGYSKPHRGGCC